MPSLATTRYAAARSRRSSARESGTRHFLFVRAGSMRRLMLAAKPNESGYSSKPYANVAARSQQVKLVPATIAILDDDHVIRLTRYAVTGPGEITTDWARDFFMPEEMDPAQVYALGSGLHAGDGVSLVPVSAKLDLGKGSDADI